MRGTNALDRKRTIIVAGAVVVAVLAVGLAFTAGAGLLGGGSDASVPAASGPSASDAGGGGGSSSGGGAGGGSAGSGGGDAGTATPTPEPPFDLDVESVESCGSTCRDVTATLENQQDRRATGVTVYTRVFAGRGTDGDVVWEGTRDVGTLDAGGADTATQRMEIGYFDAIAIKQADGWITIVLTIETDRQTVRFQERRDVA